MVGQKGRASAAGIEQIRSRMKLDGWTQADAAKACGFARSTLNQILKGQSVKLENLEELCHLLDLEVGQVLVQEESSDIETLVKQLREAVTDTMRQRCGTMRVLDMTQPIGLGAIYTDVNILERVAAKTRREIQELLANCGVEEFDRAFLGAVKEKRVDGFTAVRDKQQLMILGRPGAGKTTFLKRMAIACLEKEFLPDRVPLFVTLKEFAETENQPTLLEYLKVSLIKSDLRRAQLSQPIHNSSLAEILKAGRGLILLDGLDEVMEKDHDRIIHEIRIFAETYSQNHIIITCRVAAREYIFQQFTEVEMADFDAEQIQTFANKWFKTKENNEESITGALFWRELQEREPVKELATSPLLLTLLCLEFDNSAAFPQSRAELYERALNVLLAKWDGQRRIKRDEVYRGLSLKRKETLLGQLAMYTFERGDYFFREHIATQQIEQYIRNLPGASEDEEALLVDSRAVLKSIEAQHGLLAERATGIYSFSHLTFHEYFSAKNILDISNPAAQQQALQRLIEHISDKRWREVFLIVVERLDIADYLLQLMKHKIDGLLADEQELQEFLLWSQGKSDLMQVNYKIPAVRAFYAHLDIAIANPNILSSNDKRVSDLASDLASAIDRDLASAMDRALAGVRELANTSDRVLASVSDLANIINPVGAIDRVLANTINHDLANDVEIALIFAFASNRDCVIDVEIDLANFIALASNQDSELEQQLQELRLQLPKKGDIQKWWQQNGEKWCGDLRQVMITHRNIGHDWQFTPVQLEKLNQYYAANLLLVNCLNSECYVSREVREQIEDEMLLPIAEIEKRRQAQGE